MKRIVSSILAFLMFVSFNSSFSFALSGEDITTVESQTIVKSLPKGLSESTASIGLLGKYYKNYVPGQNQQEFCFEQVDPKIDFDWSTGGFQDVYNNFYITWDGYIAPRESGRYTFSCAHDDGVKIYIGYMEKPLINAWNDGSTVSENQMFLGAGGKYPIRIEYYENAVFANIKLSWKLNDGAMEVIPNECFITNLTGDNQGPTTPNDLQPVPGSASVQLSWQAASDNNGVLGYEIYKDNSYVGFTKSTTFTDQNLTPNTEYRYKIRAKDMSLNYSGFSSEVVTRTLPDTAPPSAAQNFNLKGCFSKSVNLSWNRATDNHKVDRYEVFQDNVKIAAVPDDGRVDTAYEYKIPNLVTNREYSFAVKAIDESENESPAASLKATPKNPKIVSTSPLSGSLMGLDYIDPNYVELNVDMENNKNSLGANLKVEYSEDGTNYLTAIDVTSYAECDTSVPLVRIKGYWNTGGFVGTKLIYLKYDLTDADGGKTTKIITAYLDKTPPAKITNIKATPMLKTVRIDFQKPSDSDIYCYYLYRASTSGGAMEAVGWPSYGETFFTDNPPDNNTHYYCVASKDRCGNVSEKSDIIECQYILDTERPIITGVSPRNGEIGKNGRIKVSAQDNYKVNEITMEFWNGSNKIAARKENAFLGYGIFDLSSIDLGATTNLTVKTYATDFGDPANTSDTVEKSYVIDGAPPSNVEGLGGVAEQNSVLLSWANANAIENVREYIVYKELLPASGENSKVEIGKTTKTTYCAAGLNFGTDYKFYVKAVDVNGNCSDFGSGFSISTQGDSQMPYVTALKPKSGMVNGNIELSCEAYDNLGLSWVKFQLRGISSTGTPIGDWNTVGEGVNSQNAKNLYKFKFNTGTVTDGRYLLRALACDTSGNFSNTVLNSMTSSDGAYTITSIAEDINSQQDVGVLVIDNTAPPALGGFSVNGNNTEGCIDIRWNAVAQDPSVSYIVERKTTLEGEPETIYTGKANSLKDFEVIRGQDYYYTVHAVDGIKNEGSRAAYTAARLNTIVDTEAPKVLSIYPQGQKKIGKTLPLSMVVKDNDAISKIEVYALKTSQSGALEEILLSRTEAINKNYISFEKAISLENATDNSGNMSIRIKTFDRAGNVDTKEMSYCVVYNAQMVDFTGLQSIGLKNILTYSVPDITQVAKFEIYRGNGVLADEALVAEKLTETQDQYYEDKKVVSGSSYTYKIVLYDIYGNKSTSALKNCIATGTDIEPPTIAAPAKIIAIKDEILFLDGIKISDNRDNAGELKYLWSFGDGQYTTAQKASHVYTAAGTFDVAIKVTDTANNITQKSITVEVLEPSEALLNVVVKDQKTGEVIEGVTAKIIPASQVSSAQNTADSQNYISGANGSMTVNALEGNNIVLLSKPGFETKTEIVNVSQEPNQVCQINMQEEQSLIGNMTVRRLSLSELLALGIDLNNPENYYTYEFTITLAFKVIKVVTPPSGVGGYTTEEPRWGDLPPDFAISGPGGIRIIGNDDNQAPTIVYMSVSGGVKWLKEMFHVSLEIKNPNHSGFGTRINVNNPVAKINLPEGCLSLVNTEGFADETFAMRPITEGETRKINWLVKGDAEGEYDIGANLTGKTSTGKDVNLTFTTGEKIRIYGGSAMRMRIAVPGYATRGVPYTFKVGLENISDIDVNMISLSMQNSSEFKPALGQRTTKEPQGKDKILRPGKTLWMTCTVIPNCDGVLDLSKSFVVGSGNVKIPYVFESYTPDIGEIGGEQVTPGGPGEPAGPGILKIMTYDRVDRPSKNVYQYSGNITFFGYIKCEGTITINRNDNSVYGEGPVYVDSPYGRVGLWQGDFNIELRDGVTDSAYVFKFLELTKTAFFDDTGISVSVADIDFNKDGMSASAQIDILGTTINLQKFTIANNGKIDLKAFGADLKFELEPLGLEAGGVSLSWNNEEQKFSLEASVSGGETDWIPFGITIGFDLVKGQLDGVKIDAKDLNIPLGTTPFFWQRVGYQCSGMVENPATANNIEACLGFSFMPELYGVSILSIDELRAKIDFKEKSFEGSGILTFLETVQASASLKLAESYTEASIKLKSLFDISELDGNIKVTYGKRPKDRPKDPVKYTITGEGSAYFLGTTQWSVKFGKLGYMVYSRMFDFCRVVFWTKIKECDHMDVKPWFDINGADPRLGGQSGSIVPPEEQNKIDTMIKAQSEGITKDIAMKEITDTSTAAEVGTSGLIDSGSYLNIVGPVSGGNFDDMIAFKWESMQKDVMLENYTVDFYLAASKDELCGKLLAKDVPISQCVLEKYIGWLQNGTYYIVAHIYNGEYFKGIERTGFEINVCHKASPPSPKMPKVTDVDGDMYVEWYIIEDESICGYNLYVENLADNKVTKINAGDSKYYVLREWEPSKYRIWLTSYNKVQITEGAPDDGTPFLRTYFTSYESQKSESAEFALEPANRPYLEVQWPSGERNGTGFIEANIKVESGTTLTILRNGEVLKEVDVVDQNPYCTFNEFIKLDKNVDEFEVVARNKEGYTKKSFYNTLQDVGVPYLTVENLKNGMMVTTDRIVATGKCEVTGTLSINGNAVVNQGGAYSYEIPLSVGQNHIVIKVADQLGKVTSFDGYVTRQ